MEYIVTDVWLFEVPLYCIVYKPSSYFLICISVNIHKNILLIYQWSAMYAISDLYKQ